MELEGKWLLTRFNISLTSYTPCIVQLYVNAWELFEADITILRYPSVLETLQCFASQL